MTPRIQELINEILNLMGYIHFTLNAKKTDAQRQRIQDAWNDPKSTTLLAAAKVCGVGYNLQKCSRTAFMVDTPETQQQEDQVAGQQHRGGQELTVYFPEDDVESFTERSEERRQVFKEAATRLPTTELSPLVWAFLQVSDLECVKEIAHYSLFSCPRAITDKYYLYNSIFSTISAHRTLASLYRLASSLGKQLW
ncbi:hypothetical protein IQ07DRAFT_645257 [Pyrenochaeta sp. DS3sAY3a]|nr:hypothetical protein IQ07DRAFT_645257 [Pyrenochaeta sp. DS3sAY3a]